MDTNRTCNRTRNTRSVHNTTAHFLSTLAVGIFLTLTMIMDGHAKNIDNINHRYIVQINPELTHLKVQACFTHRVPKKLVSYDHLARHDISAITLISKSNTRRLTVTPDSSIHLADIQAGDCVSYTSALIGKTGHSRFNTQQSTHRQKLLSIHRWLWLPATEDSQSTSLDIVFKLPAALSISTPWPQIAKDKRSVTYRYGLSQRSVDNDGLIAIGEFKTASRKFGKAQINIALLNGQPALSTAETLHWIDKNLHALMLAYGKFPVDHLQILIIPIGRDREPVPWGQVMRGGGDGVHLYIDQTRPQQEFLDDWVLIHELSHLLHPQMSSSDAWLSEGLASYYQNVLRARAKLLTPERAWEKLHQGFQRGIRGTSSRQTLAQTSESMMRNRSFMRVYWSGAAIGLLADHRLRKQSQGKMSLDSALAEFQDCCLPSQGDWTARQFMQKLDDISQTEIFSQLYFQYTPSYDFPDLSQLYKELGLIGQQNHIRLDDTAVSSHIRHHIMSSRQ